MQRRGYPIHLIKVIKSLYNGTQIRIKTNRLSEPIGITQGVRQGCSLSPVLFNIYIDDAIRKWKLDAPKGLYLGKGFYLNILMYADDLVIIQENENDLQRSLFYLTDILADYNQTISLSKTKVMAFSGANHIRTKIVIRCV